MATLNSAALAGSIIVAILACILVLVGVINIRSGQQALANPANPALKTTWHKHPDILFGLNNLVFALLIVLGGFLLLVKDNTPRYILVGLIVLTFLVSIFLVTRTMRSASQTAKRLQEQRRLNKK